METNSSSADPFGSYYDPSPPMNLSRPLVVCSFFGFGGSAIAKRIAALGGWPHVDVYEQTAHKLGEHKAVPHIGTENPAWSIAEERVIQRALTRKPCPVIGLSDGHQPTAHIADLIQRQARLVVIKGDWLQAQEALLDEIAAAPERLPEFTERPIPDLHSLQLLYREREALYRQAEITIDAAKLGASVAAQCVVRGLGLEASS